jgi:hypothetical protein
MAASLLALAVALLVGAGTGVDRGVAATVEAEGTEVRFLDLEIRFEIVPHFYHRVCV